MTVALSGQGADELLAGYDRYRQIELIDRWAAVPARAPRGLEPPSARRGSARLRRAARSPPRRPRRGERDGAIRMGETGAPRSAVGRSRRTSRRRCSSRRSRIGSEAPAPEASSGALVLDAQLSLVDDMLHYFDRTSMAHSLEVRVPYLDHRLVEFCSRMPIAAEAATAGRPSGSCDRSPAVSFRTS